MLPEPIAMRTTERDGWEQAPHAGSAPLCQEAGLFGFGSLEKVIVKMTGRVEDLDADEAAVFPVHGDEPAGSGRHVGLDCGAARRERVAGEVDVGRVGFGVVGDPHPSIVLR
jgi:hypothetical protein